MRESYYDEERLVLVGLSYVELTDTSAYGAYADYSGGVDGGLRRERAGVLRQS